MSGGDWKAMFKAIQNNDLELVAFYLRSRIDPNYQHPEYMALPLAESIRYNHLDIAKLLLSNGADPQIIEMESGCSCLALANDLKNELAVELLKSYIDA